MPKSPITIDQLPKPPLGKVGFPWTIGTPLPKDADQKNYPRITVVTPSYQQGQYLEETIRSVLLQGYPNLDYWVIDGGSKDASVAIITKYAPFLSGWVSEKDRGQTDAINKGLRLGNGDIMGWLNSDDVLQPNALLKIRQALKDHPEWEAVTGFRRIINESSKVTSNFIRDLPTPYYLGVYNMIPQEATYWRRSVWEKLGELDETYQFAMDYEYWLRMLQAGIQIHQIPEVLGYWRRHGLAKTSAWNDVHERDLIRLKERISTVRAGEISESRSYFGERWWHTYEFFRDLSFNVRLSWSPRKMLMLKRILSLPILGDGVLSLFWRYRGFRTRENAIQHTLQHRKADQARLVLMTLNPFLRVPAQDK